LSAIYKNIRILTDEVGNKEGRRVGFSDGAFDGRVVVGNAV
jgi:hypothetical protein